MSNGRPVYIDPHKPLIIRGGAYSLLSQQGKDKIFAPEPVKLSEQAEKLKQDIAKSAGFWAALRENYDNYNITPEEYFEIAKFAIDLYPLTMGKVRDEKLSAKQYYDLCAIMAKRGVFNGINYGKLTNAYPNALYKIMFIALIKSVFLPTNDNEDAPDNEDTPSTILSAMRKNSRRFQPKEKNALCFALWVCMQPREFVESISCEDLKGITVQTVEYVKDIIICEIYKAPNSNFVNRLNFVSIMLDENRGMPQSVNDACQQIVAAIHDAGAKRIDMKEKRRER